MRTTVAMAHFASFFACLPFLTLKIRIEVRNGIKIVEGQFRFAIKAGRARRNQWISKILCRAAVSRWSALR